MAITDFPWFKIYAAETLSDENFTSWGPSERGAWFTLLCHCWKEGSIPSDETRLARLCGTDAHAMHEIWPSIADRFYKQPDGGRLVCVRLEFERQKSIEEVEGKSQHGKKAAHARWSKYKSEMLGHCSGIAPTVPDDAPQPQPQPQPKDTSRTPPATRIKPPKKASWKDSLDQEVVEATGKVMAIWPDSSKSQPKKGETVPASKGPEVAKRLLRIKSQGGDLGICVVIAERFVDEFNRGGMWARAAENFFGFSDDAPWQSYYQAEVYNRTLGTTAQEVPNAS